MRKRRVDLAAAEATTLSDNTVQSTYLYLNSLTKAVLERKMTVPCLTPLGPCLYLVLKEICVPVMSCCVRLSGCGLLSLWVLLGTDCCCGVCVYFIPELHNELGIHSGAPCFCYVQGDCVYPWVFRQGLIGVYCLGCGAAVAGLWHLTCLLTIINDVACSLCQGSMGIDYCIKLCHCCVVCQT